MTDTYNSRDAQLGGQNADTQPRSVPTRQIPKQVSRQIPSQLPKQTQASSPPTSSQVPTRSRRSRSRSSRRPAAPVERRRLFSTGSERVKSKSASRTRALKAKPIQPSSQPGGQSQSSQRQNAARVRPFRQPKRAGHSRSIPNGSMANGSVANGSVANGSVANGLVASQTGPLRAKARPTLPNTSATGRVPPSRGLVRRRHRSLKTPASVRYIIQLIIVGLGVAAIGGTLLKALPKAPAQEAVEIAPAAQPQGPTKTFPIELTREIAPLKAELEALPNLYPSLVPKVFYVDVDTGEYVSVGGGEAIAAASTIKLPILLAFFEEVDAGRIDLTQVMSMQPQQIASGSGDMQVADPSTQYTALEVASQMIVNSDNTATNMMIDLLGGPEALNSRFVGYGLEATELNAPLPDLEGTNLTSSRDLAHTMLLISQGQSLSTRSRDRVLNILKRTRSKGLLPATLEERGALTYNKTGDIGSVLGDVALVDVPNGKRYVVAALVQRPNNDGRARELIRRVSARTYQLAEKAIQPAVVPPEPAADSGTSSTSEAADSGEDFITQP
ncbi:serine hydrolase [cf. Phormidesmis sp. LEGE 11477]|uniref:serine hydrolase n=1 Tax=cf. Phormidesmis sp. LEGE 11477 TaxID=1828680 RepID=UPI00187FB71B|nr:serine hydrolase [cf. Phormidesmis sp. LEGE 11477]MBE9062052.1 serine hydrolase [cf. Phormidesmis sp. LEGE 11477]